MLFLMAVFEQDALCEGKLRFREVGFAGRKSKSCIRIVFWEETSLPAKSKSSEVTRKMSRLSRLVFRIAVLRQCQCEKTSKLCDNP